MICAFIFARGGSKGIPKKNIKELGGTPLLCHSIRQAKAVSEIEQIFVSTDDPEIAWIADSEGAQIINRPEDLATDTANEWHAWQHAISVVEAKFPSFSTFVSLPATNPLREPQDIKRCISNLKGDVDIVVTVTKAHRNPYFNMIQFNNQGYAELIFQNSKVTRRQDAPRVYDMSTLAYVARPDYIRSNNSIFDGNVKALLFPKERSIDIDTELDFKFCEFIFQEQENDES